MCVFGVPWQIVIVTDEIIHVCVWCALADCGLRSSSQCVSRLHTCLDGGGHNVAKPAPCGNAPESA